MGRSRDLEGESVINLGKSSKTGMPGRADFEDFGAKNRPGASSTANGAFPLREKVFPRCGGPQR